MRTVSTTNRKFIVTSPLSAGSAFTILKISIMPKFDNKSLWVYNRILNS